MKWQTKNLQGQKKTLQEDDRLVGVLVASGSKTQMETLLALIEEEILFVPRFGTKRLERKAGIWSYSLP